MDRYERLFRDLYDKTMQGTLSWESFDAARYESSIMNFRHVAQTFRADYRLDGQQYTLLLVVRKEPVYCNDVYEVLDGRDPEILFFLGTRQIFALTHRHVNRSELLALVECVSEMNVESNNLLRHFD